LEDTSHYAHRFWLTRLSSPLQGLVRDHKKSD
jgi:hypothetical protein